MRVEVLRSRVGVSVFGFWVETFGVGAAVAYVHVAERVLEGRRREPEGGEVVARAHHHLLSYTRRLEKVWEVELESVREKLAPPGVSILGFLFFFVWDFFSSSLFGISSHLLCLGFLLFLFI